MGPPEGGLGERAADIASRARVHAAYLAVTRPALLQPVIGNPRLLLAVFSRSPSYTHRAFPRGARVGRGWGCTESNSDKFICMGKISNRLRDTKIDPSEWPKLTFVPNIVACPQRPAEPNFHALLYSQVDLPYTCQVQLTLHFPSRLALHLPGPTYPTLPSRLALHLPGPTYPTLPSRLALHFPTQLTLHFPVDLPLHLPGPTYPTLPKSTCPTLPNPTYPTPPSRLAPTLARSNLPYTSQSTCPTLARSNLPYTSQVNKI
jgi:hypothetical protein